ncbi:MAG: pyridoxal-dependent decarboxylase, partial [Candidatus Aminicenantales bacterium]
MIRTMEPEDWGLAAAGDGALLIGECRAKDLARAYGTPLHVIHEPRLEETGVRFRKAFEKAYPGRTSIHFAFKCNSVPAVLSAVRRAGLKAEVMSEFELDLALRL